MNNKYYLSLAAASILWGIQPIALKFVIAEMTVPMMIPLRYLLLGLTLFFIMYLHGEQKFLPDKNLLIKLALMGFSGVAVSNGAQFEGLRYTTVANATLISATCPAMTALLAALFVRERLSLLRWLGIAISLGGTLYLVSGGSLAVIFNMSFNLGDVLYAVGEMGWAVCCLISYPVMKKMSVLAATAWFGLFGGLMTAVYGLFTDQMVLPDFTAIGFVSFLFVIWGGGVMAMMLWNLGLKHTGASTASIFLNLMPIVGIACAALTIGEIVTFNEVIGAAVIISGVYITTHS